MSKVKQRLVSILTAIEDIEYITNNLDLKITKAIEDRLVKPAIRMNLMQIAEQFKKLKHDNEFETLQNFSSLDLKGISALRNYIAHDYDSTDEHIIEDVIRYNLPKFKEIVERLLKD